MLRHGRNALFVAGLCAAVSAERLPVRSYTTADGLPRNAITCIRQDARGLLWFATSEGLVRFDGQRFVTFDVRDGLPHSQVFDILLPRDGGMWVATRTGLCRLDGNRFQEIRWTGGEQPGLLSDLREDRAGRIWTAGENGLFLVEPGAETLRLKPVPLNGRRNPAVLCLLEDRRGDLWAGTVNGLYRIRAGHAAQRHPLPHDYVTALYEDRRGRIWAAAGHTGVSRLVADPEPRRGIVERTFTTRDGLASDRVNTIYETSTGRLLLGLSDGLAEMLPSGERFRIYDRSHGLSGTSIDVIHEDPEGNLWLGAVQGIMKIPRHGFLSFTETDGLAHLNTREIFERRNGELIVVARSTLVHRFDGRRFHAVEPPLPGMGSLGRGKGWGTHQTILEDSAGEWWVPTDEGLYRYPKVRRIEDLATTLPKAHYSAGKGLPDPGVFGLYEDRRGGIWISTTGPEPALTRWDRATDRFQRQQVMTHRKMEAPVAFLEDRTGALWIGFYDGGLARYRQGRFEYFSAADGGPFGQVHQIHQDRKGRLWVAFSGGGLLRVDEPAAARPRFRIYSKQDGLSSRSVLCVTEDNWGRIYAGTGSGIDRFDPDSPCALDCLRHFNTADGLMLGDVHTAFRDRQGVLWFATNNGLSSYQPDPPGASQPPPILITGLRVAGTDYPLDVMGASSIHGLRLSPDQHNVEFSFSALSFAPGTAQHYRYRLEGLDPSWSAPAGQRQVSYAGLPPGRYQFEVRAIPPESEAPSASASVEFAVQPHLWQAAWFRLLLLLAVAAGLWLWHRYRLRRVLELEQVRMRIATDLHDDLGAALSEVAVLSEVAIRDGQFGTREQVLSRIARLSRDMLAATGDIVWLTRPSRDRFIDLVSRIRAHAGESLSALGIDFELHAPESALKLDPDLRRQAFYIFKECLHNAVVHSGCSKVDVTLEAGSRDLRLVFRDDGKGFAVPPAQSPAAGRHGLAGMRWRAATIGARLTIRSEPGSGAEILLEAPIHPSTPHKLVGPRHARSA